MIVYLVVFLALTASSTDSFLKKTEEVDCSTLKDQVNDKALEANKAHYGALKVVEDYKDELELLRTVLETIHHEYEVA